MESDSTTSKRAKHYWAMAAIAALVLCILSTVVWVVKNGGLDTRARRTRSAERLQELARNYKENPGDERLVELLKDAAQSRYSFERYYAQGTIGRLEELGTPFIDVLANNLRTGDAFDRDTAAQAFMRMGVHASPARDSLIWVIENHVNERAAMFATEALSAIGDNSPQVLEVLVWSANTKDSYTYESAREAYKNLTGEDMVLDE